MKALSEKNKVLRIKVNLDKCIGCRACELACSVFHSFPKYSSTNPARSRIRVVIDPRNDEYVPVRSCDYTKAACDGRRVYTINEKEYSECSFCGTICPTRDLFKDPDSGLPLRCDLCEDDPAQEEPLCVQACQPGALIYEEIEGESGEEVKLNEVDIGLKSMLDKYGLLILTDSFARLLQKE